MEEDKDSKVFSRFERSEEFFAALDDFLSVYDAGPPHSAPSEATVDEGSRRTHLLHFKLIRILQEYQEHPYLLDPYLERIVVPVVAALKRHVVSLVTAPQAAWSNQQLDQLCTLLFNVIRTRGHKTIVRFFPHEVPDLPLVLSYLQLERGPATKPAFWHLRYVMLLWLSLICMIPFDLHRFDNRTSLGQTMAALKSIASKYLDTAGLERDGAAILLAKLYARRDADVEFEQFLQWAQAQVEDEAALFKSLGVLRSLSDYLSLVSAEQYSRHEPSIQNIIQSAGRFAERSHSALGRRLRIKLICRSALKILPPPRPRRRPARTLMMQSVDESVSDAEAASDFDVPERIDHAVAEILQALEDTDTTVRWSASKAIARIAECLPPDFAEQVLESVLALFSLHAWQANDESLDLPPSAEYTWHGACLACAEMARRGLIAASRLPEVIPWLIKALHFDIRKGAHSIGSSVRDAAAYVAWSLARSQAADGVRPFAVVLAQQLVVVSLFDREVHIRRAASAAFQENVGRMGFFPHGISVLAKIDFYSVSIRRNSFEVAAPLVAVHVEYQHAIVSHILKTVIRHWDPAMRVLGAQALRVVCEVDMKTLGDEAKAQLEDGLKSVDINHVNGTLLAYSELAGAYNARGTAEYESRRFEIFQALEKVPENMFHRRQSDLVLEGCCLVIANSISSSSVTAHATRTALWRKIIGDSLQRRSTVVQEAAALAMASLSRLESCSAELTSSTLIADFSSGTQVTQLSAAHTLGVLAYDVHDHGVRDVIRCLVAGVDKAAPTFNHTVEVRQKCFESLPSILKTLGPAVLQKCDAAMMHSIYDSLITGLEDYSTDERGDVGSWVRMACLRGLVTVSTLLFSLCRSRESILRSLLPPDMHQRAISGIIKQGAERLDNVRQQAGVQIRSLIACQCPAPWSIRGEHAFSKLFCGDEEESWADASWLFPRLVQFLAVIEYRKALLHGLVLSIGSKTDSTHRPAATSLAEHLKSSPAETTIEIAEDILDLGKANFTSNHHAIPVLQTINVLLEADALSSLSGITAGQSVLGSILELAVRNAGRMKNVQRIVATMKIVANLVAVPSTARDAVGALPIFLAHQFPKVRAETAETLYLVLQARGIESPEAEDLLLETEWSTIAQQDLERISGAITARLLDAVPS